MVNHCSQKWLTIKVNAYERVVFTTYILYSLKDDKLYIGYTPADVFSRLEKHQWGLVPSTKYRLPLKLIYFETYINQKDALRRERYFKTTAGKRAIKLMLRETLTELRNKSKK